MRQIVLLIAFAIASPSLAQERNAKGDNLVDGLPARVWNKLHPRAWPPAPVRAWENPGNERAYAHVLNRPTVTPSYRVVTPSYRVVPQTTCTPSGCYTTPTPQYVTPQYVTPQTYPQAQPQVIYVQPMPAQPTPTPYGQPSPYVQPSPYGYQPGYYVPPSFYRPSRSPLGTLDSVNDRARREEKTGGKQCLIDGRIHLGSQMQSYDLGTESVAFISRTAATRSTPAIRLIAAQQYISLRAKSNDPLTAEESRALLSLVIR